MCVTIVLIAMYVQVSLGKSHELLDANADAHKLPSGYHSVKGLGKMAPDSAHNRVLYVGVLYIVQCSQVQTACYLSAK